MIHELDMKGAKKLGEMGEQSVTSICWNCKKPVGECEWIMYGKPYAGSQYWVRRCYYYAHTKYNVYAIVKCPKEQKGGK